MPPVNPAIIASIQAPQFRTPLEHQARAAELRRQFLEQHVASYKLAAAQREQQDIDAMRQVIAEAGGVEQALPILKQHFPMQALQIEKELGDLKRSQQRIVPAGASVLDENDQVVFTGPMREAASEPLVAVIGDDGKPVMLPRSQAAGRAPASATGDDTERRSLEIQASDALRRGDSAEYKRLLQVKREMGQADDRPLQPRISVPVVIQTAEGPQLLDRGTATVKPIMGQGGQPLGPAPTADMRNRAEARKLVGKSIDAIESLSQKVITKRGIAQRATAAGRSVEAALGNDPEYRTYQDARMALAGNLAVGQQGSRPSDADIKAIWLPLVPDVFRDTDESAAMKWGLIKTMSNVEAAAPSTAQPATAPAGGGAVPTYQEYLQRRGGAR